MGATMEKLVDLKRLEDDNEFLVELVKLNQLALEKKSMEEFFNKAIDLLEYILCTENSSLALLLTESFIIIQKNSEIYLTDRPIIVEQLCNAFLIQFKYSKNEIYLNILKILTNCNGIFDIKNVENISKKTLKRIDPCIYECFDLRITLKLMNLYLIIDFTSFKMLFDDMMLDFFLLDDQVTEQSFERLLWYALISGNVDILRDEVTKYDLFIKSKREEVRIYRLLMNHLEGKDSLDLKRIYHTVNKIKTLDSLTNFEKVIISKLVLIQVEKN